MENVGNLQGAKSKGQVIIKKPKVSWLWALFGGMSLFVVTGLGSFYYFVSSPATAPLEKLAGALSGVFGTEVTVNGSTVVLEKSEIGELALVQRKTQAIVKYETSWMGSKKTLIVRGDFLVKAGFDLSEGGHWGILEGKVEGALPEGKVLSVEPIGDFEIYYSGNGAINRLKPEDHARAFNYLKDQARRDAELSEMGKEAEDVLLRRINDRVSGLDSALQWEKKILP